MNITIKANTETFYQKYYQLLNGIFNLTKKELLILSTVSSRVANYISVFNMSYAEANKKAFSTINRKEMCTELDISIYNLNNYIKNLKDRQLLISNKGLVINEKIFLNCYDTKSVEFKATVTIL